MIDALLGLLLATLVTVVLALAAAGLTHLLIKRGVFKDDDNDAY
jgi:hypothetical protein